MQVRSGGSAEWGVVVGSADCRVRSTAAWESWACGAGGDQAGCPGQEMEVQKTASRAGPSPALSGGQIRTTWTDLDLL